MSFKRPTLRYGDTPEPVTPYQKAAQVWDERLGAARVQAHNWRLMALGSLVLSAGLRLTAPALGMAVKGRLDDRARTPAGLGCARPAPAL